MTLTRDRKVLQLARDLGLSARGNPLTALSAHAVRQVEDFIRNASIPVGTLDTLRRVVSDKFRVKVEVIECDDDVRRIAADHAGFSPYLLTQLTEEFLEGTTEGITIERELYDPFRCRYLVVVDARGDRQPRVYFTVWHELTHLLLHPEQTAFPGFRRTPPLDERLKDPIEQVIDHVAAQVAFYDPLFRGPAEAAIARHGGVTFAAVDDARERAGIPDASVYATAMRTIFYTSFPTLLVTVGRVFKPSEQRRIRSVQGDLGLAPAPTPTPQLRLTACIANKAAESAGVEIWRHMRVPLDSILAQAAASESDEVWVANEDQSWWSTSERGSLSGLPLRVEAARRGQFVYGLISVPIAA